jgi:hypothetical protein
MLMAAKKAKVPEERTGGSPGGPKVPEAVRPAYDAIVALIDAFCKEHLNDEYAELGREMAATLARKRPSPLTKGKPASWASGIVRTVGFVNFLDDPGQQPHMRLMDVSSAFGVSDSTAAAKAGVIRDLLKVHRFDPDWTVRSNLDRNPMIWILSVNGLLMDIRDAPREVQVVAYEQGLIPYIPADRDESSKREG